MTLSLLSATLVCSAAVFLLLIRHLFSYKSLNNNLRGPPAPSKLFGNEYQLDFNTDAGALDFEWIREYGSTWRTHGYFGVKQTMTADPKAIQHILHKSGYNYPKRIDRNHSTLLLLGPGILWSHGEVHQRHRKVMNPAFTAQQLRTFIPLFQRTAKKVAAKWKTIAESDANGVIVVNKWLARSALDIIGEAAFDYKFGAVDNQETPLAKEYSTIFTDSSLFPTKANMLYRGIFPYLPQSLLKLTKYAPTRLYGRFRAINKMFAGVGKPLIEASIQGGAAAREGKRDVLSVLAKANVDDTARIRLGDDEVLAQMHHLTAAGHETTSSTLTWMFYELAKHPEYQNRVREEIRAAREAATARGDADFTLDDLDNMKYTLATIKETLRFHTIVYHMWRYAAKDDVLPLSEPVVGKDGKLMHEIPVSAGEAITISVCGYSRLPHVWGEDADTWNPDRFFTHDSEKQVKVGVYANLLSFSAGLRACIGWRFALNQLQAVSAELLEAFEFSLPEDKPHIMRVPSGIMVPIIEGREDLGSAMPLRVSVAQ